MRGRIYMKTTKRIELATITIVIFAAVRGHVVPTHLITEAKTATGGGFNPMDGFRCWR